MKSLLFACATLTAPALAGSPVHAQTTTPSPGFTYSDPFVVPGGSLYDSLGQTVHTWAFGAEPQAGSYLDQDGYVWRTYTIGLLGVAVGGALQKVAFDGTILWDYIVPTPGFQHHDIEVLPNGNVLITVQDVYTLTEAVAMGADPSVVHDPLYSDSIIEVKPTGPTTGDIVWQWNAIDHIVQDFAPLAPNFDVIANRPERANINYKADVGSLYWLHLNGVDYSPELDQIALSCRDIDEVWIIDHSTTTAEAAGTIGGQSGKGGDLLYRWGNPAAYDTAGPQQYSRQHDVTWIEPGRPGTGNLLCFNNKKGSLLGLGDASAITEIVPPVDAFGNYSLTPGQAHGPAAPTWEYMAPTPTDFYSALISGAERLPNGNTLVTSGDQTLVFELGLGDQIVWSKTIPRTFKVRRYEYFLFAHPQEISIATGGTAELNVTSGSENAGNFYWVLGTMFGTSPGFSVQGHHVPLNPVGSYFNITLGLGALVGSFGVVDGLGNAQATLPLPPGLNPALVGLTAHHAYAIFDAVGDVKLVSEARPVALLP